MVKKEVIACRSQISDAISWSLIYQIMRRYQSSLRLHLLELHPGGGQYDCLSLRPYQYGQPDGWLFDFNLQAQSLHVCMRDRFDIVDDYLRADDPKDVLDLICRTAKLDPYISTPPSNGPVVATGVMAGLMQMNIFSRRRLKFFMDTVDTSGEGGGSSKAFQKFVSTRSIPIAGSYRYFYLSDLQDTGDEPLCLFDMAGKVFFRDASEMELLSAYNKKNRNITPLIYEIAQRVNI